VGISFVVTPDWTVRYCVVFPVMALIVAIGLRYTSEILLPLLPRHALTILPLLMLTGVGVAQLSHYFGEHLSLYNLQVRQTMRDFYDVFDRAAKVPDISRLIYITDDNVFTPVLDTTRVFRPVAMPYEIWNRSEGFQAQLESLPAGEAYAFALVPDDTETLAAVEASFPVTLGPWSAYQSVPLERQYALYLYHPENR
jgi:hypothetical protein